ncbi:nuclear transport factor 2 family protein [Nocardiopsis suaedae]|uniref:Nuclear transport factor 2 family protein n=1 Tax=Nocardiopsis suaedae TaxID=3018444 RepID=A0ABT4THT0_9ACTN|nr:nuclear transport factor 2 family protein [Nocardiopsis suaedae]MDA2804264.1 nuclear transport factor 2 family protein [Nocardiopsis suaedae]
MPANVNDAAVRAFIDAVNAGDRVAFSEALTPDATMTDDGRERDLLQWAEREIFSANGRMDVVSTADGGRSLIADFTNDTWGAMRTRWTFTVEDGRIARFDTGQA